MIKLNIVYSKDEDCFNYAQYIWLVNQDRKTVYGCSTICNHSSTVVTYSKNLEVHGESDPSLFCFNNLNNNFILIQWYKEGNLHRNNYDGTSPASFHYNEQGKLVCYIFYHKGKKHNLYGPAINDIDGTKEWWINDLLFEEDKHPFNIFKKKYNLNNDFLCWSEDLKLLYNFEIENYK